MWIYVYSCYEFVANGIRHVLVDPFSIFSLTLSSFVQSKYRSMPSPFDDELISVLALKALRVTAIVGGLTIYI